jgi:PEP-CTERM motif
MSYFKSTRTAAVATAILVMLGQQPAHALLGGFEVADGYTQTFGNDVWSYDAGASGATFIPSQYNTGRFQELVGSSAVNTDAQYVSRHGYGGGGANVAPFALAVRSISPAGAPNYDMTIGYDVGIDDLGVAPTTPLASAVVAFDICPGVTWDPLAVGFDTVFNDVPAFSLSIGGTDTAPGVTIGFSDSDPGNGLDTKLTYIDNTTYNSTVVPWSGRFDNIIVDFNFITQTYDLYWTRDFNLSTIEFDTGNAPILIASGVSMTTPVNTIEQMYFRAHTDPGDGVTTAGLEKSFLDNFQFAVTPVPEPASFAVLAVGAMATGLRRRQTR